MEVSQFPGGHSNLTYLVRFGGAELVLRRPPLGPVPPKAHDMAREYRWLAALTRCSRSRRGRTCSARTRRSSAPSSTSWSAAAASSCAARSRWRSRITRTRGAAVSEALVDTLADLHASTSAAAARRARQAGAGSSSGRCAAGPSGGRARSRDAARNGRARRVARSRASRRRRLPAVVHGDFKLDNVLLDPLDLGTSGRGVRLGDERARRSAGRPRASCWRYWAPTAPPGQRDALTRSRIGPATSRARRSSSATRTRSGRDVSRHPLLRDVCAVQDRRRHPADIYYRY